MALITKHLMDFHKLYLGIKRITSPAIAMQLSVGQRAALLDSTQLHHTGAYRTRLQCPVETTRGIWTEKVKLSKKLLDDNVGTITVTLGNAHYQFVHFSVANPADLDLGFICY